MDQQEEAAIVPGPTKQEPEAAPTDPPFNIDSITQTTLTSVADLIDLSESLLLPTEGFWRSWAFRGQPEVCNTLVPSLQREFKRKAFGTAEIIERRMIEAFREHYRLLKDRSVEMPHPDSIKPQHDLRCLSVMQHYEIPTRLLDWTSNMWIAIYFACASKPGIQAELWCYDRNIFSSQRMQNHEFDPFVSSSPYDPLASTIAYDPPEPTFLSRRSEALIVELDPQITPRMKEQQAHHTVSSNAFSDHAPQIFDLQSQHFHPDQRTGLRRYLIAGSCKSNALQFLADEKKITASSIFPDVVGLGRFLRWQFESLRTMML